SISLLRPEDEPPLLRGLPIRKPWLLTMRAICSCQPSIARATLAAPSIKSLQAGLEARLPSVLVHLHQWLVIARAICLCQTLAATSINLLQAEYEAPLRPEWLASSPLCSQVVLCKGRP